MRKRVNALSIAVLQPIQLAAIAMSMALQKRRAPRQGMSAFSRAAIITSGTCTIVFAARSSVPKANRAPVQIDPIDSPREEISKNCRYAVGGLESLLQHAAVALLRFRFLLLEARILKSGLTR